MEEAVARVERLRNFFREDSGGGGESGEDSPEQQRGGSGEPPRTLRAPERLVERFGSAGG